MGRFPQKRLVRKRDLEMAIASIEANPNPKVHLEQYATPSTVAADALHVAAYIFDDIIDKTVIELGCGTARLALGAAYLGAKEVFGVDIDPVAIKIAQLNANFMSFKEKTNWVVGDITVVRGVFDTVLQNPPFGVQKRRADRHFLVKALELASTIYSFHKAGDSNRAFIKRFIEEHGGKITNIFPVTMEIPWMFKFHTKKKQITHVDLYRIEGKR
jgi:putative methylase